LCSASGAHTGSAVLRPPPQRREGLCSWATIDRLGRESRPAKPHTAFSITTQSIDFQPSLFARRRPQRSGNDGDSLCASTICLATARVLLSWSQRCSTPSREDGRWYWTAAEVAPVGVSESARGGVGLARHLGFLPWWRAGWAAEGMGALAGTIQAGLGHVHVLFATGATEHHLHALLDHA
jgi:hypothetical protein